VFSRCSITPKNEDLMRKITLTLAAAALVFGSLAVANAQTQGASSLNAQAQNATPIVKHTACRGWGRCPPGRFWACGPGGCFCRWC
jgi:hypothetical protein